VEIETKMALRDAEMARLEALLEKTKDECSKQIKQEVTVLNHVLLQSRLSQVSRRQWQHAV